MIYSKLGKHEDALKMYEKDLDIKKKISGENSLEVVSLTTCS